VIKVNSFADSNIRIFMGIEPRIAAYAFVEGRMQVMYNPTTD